MALFSLSFTLPNVDAASLIHLLWSSVITLGWVSCRDWLQRHVMSRCKNSRSHMHMSILHAPPWFLLSRYSSPNLLLMTFSFFSSFFFVTMMCEDLLNYHGTMMYWVNLLAWCCRLGGTPTVTSISLVVADSDILVSCLCIVAWQAGTQTYSTHWDIWTGWCFHQGRTGRNGILPGSENLCWSAYCFYFSNQNTAV